MNVGDQVRITVCPDIYKRQRDEIIGKLGTITYIYPMAPLSVPDHLTRVQLVDGRIIDLYEREIEVVLAE